MRSLPLGALAALAALLLGCRAAPKPRPKVESKPAPAIRYQVVTQLALKAPEGAQRLRAWIPLARELAETPGAVRITSTPRQTHRLTRDADGNPLLSLDLRKPDPGQRLEVLQTLEARPLAMRLDPRRTRALTQREIERERTLVRGAPPGVMPDDGLRDLAGSIIGAESNPLRRARLLFDWLLRTIGPAEPVAGLGSARRALTARAAGSADAAALFVALCRAVDVPARCCRGLVWAAGSGEAGVEVIPSELRWWAAVRVPGLGWIPVDPGAAIAAKAAGAEVGASDRRDLSGPGFGRHDGRRLTLRRGLGWALQPAPAAAPEEPLGGAYLEADERPLPAPAMQRVVRRLGKPRAPKGSPKANPKASPKGSPRKPPPSRKPAPPRKR